MILKLAEMLHPNDSNSHLNLAHDATVDDDQGLLFEHATKPWMWKNTIPLIGFDCTFSQIHDDRARSSCCYSVSGHHHLLL